MPFDGLGYLAPASKQSLWTRMSTYLLGDSPGTKTSTKTMPPHLFTPVPATQPDALTVQVLTIGRALIEDRHDWVQRRYETRDGRRCAVGALRRAARLMNVPSPQVGANAVLLSVAISRGFSDIESMNDNSTHRQVLTAFDDAITRASRHT